VDFFFQPFLLVMASLDHLLLFFRVNVSILCILYIAT
jgi:hypothetical protein